MPARTGQQYIEGVRAQEREVWLGGERVKDVTKHPGLAGGVQLAGVTYRLYGGSSPGYGYTAIAVALVGQLHPVGVLLSALFFGALVAGSNEMQRMCG